MILYTHNNNNSHLYIYYYNYKLCIYLFSFSYIYSEEKNVQQLVASMAAWKTILQSALPCMLILFWGSWSDR